MNAAAERLKKSPPLYKSLFVQVVVALLLGIVLGMATPGFATGLKFFSDAFLKLISMIVAPIVFCVVVHGIAGAGDLKKVGRVGGKALIYFECMTTVALIVGLALAFLVAPGKGMNINVASLDSHALTTYADSAHKLRGAGIGSFILNIIPTTTSFPRLRSTRWLATTCSRCWSSPSCSASVSPWSGSARSRSRTWLTPPPWCCSG